MKGTPYNAYIYLIFIDYLLLCVGTELGDGDIGKKKKKEKADPCLHGVSH